MLLNGLHWWDPSNVTFSSDQSTSKIVRQKYSDKMRDKSILIIIALLLFSVKFLPSRASTAPPFESPVADPSSIWTSFVQDVMQKLPNQGCFTKVFLDQNSPAKNDFMPLLKLLKKTAKRWGYSAMYYQIKKVNLKILFCQSCFTLIFSCCNNLTTT